MHPLLRSPRARRAALVYVAIPALGVLDGTASGIGTVAAFAMVAPAFEAGPTGQDAR